MFSFNVQHDCVNAGCTDSGIHQLIQERAETSITNSHIEHRDLESHIINLHSLHNPHLLREALPRSVWAPQHVIDPADQEARHAVIAEQLHSTQSEKRAKTKEKRAAKTKELLEKATKIAESMLGEEDSEMVAVADMSKQTASTRKR